MADVQIAVKGIQYDFDEKDSIYQQVLQSAMETESEKYSDEQGFWNEEFDALLADGEVEDKADYKENYLELSPSDIDYFEPFDSNVNHPQIQAEIKEIADKYMCNALDLPSTVVITIDDQYIDKNGKADPNAVKQAVSQKLETDVSLSYRDASKATPKDIATQKGYDAISKMMKSDDYTAFLNLRASINKYSSKNITMIYSQNPDAKAVMGFNAWKKDYDRSVEKGASGLQIWLPSMQHMKTEEQVDKYLDYHRLDYPPDSTARKEEKEKLMKEIEERGVADRLNGYSLGYVFDVSSTVPKDPEHDNIDKILNLDKPLDSNMENYDKVVESLKKAATITEINIGVSEEKQENLYTAVKEYAEKVFSETPAAINGIKSISPSKGSLHEAEVLCATYLACKHIGIDCEDKIGIELARTFGDSNIMDKNVLEKGKRNIFTEAFDRACKMSDQFCKEFDKSYEEKTKNKNVKKDKSGVEMA